ncbi:hypothetical protein [Nigerium massiliense]|uniref:hypothetical protein n=1 Tax=Nigerium massiliense TaxID=1522317 RepID=UPI00058CE6E4|nr:hypothetical protein [Nigerium massiliense]
MPDTLSRRRALTLGSAGAAATAALTLTNPADALAAARTEPAPAPSGGDDTNILIDAFRHGRLLGEGTYRCFRPIDLPAIAAVGIPGKTVIEVNAEACISSSKPWARFHLSGIDFSCDTKKCRNVIRNTYTGTNVAGVKYIGDSRMVGYNRAAISLAQIDNPYVIVERCQFYGASMTTSSGIALVGGMDGSRIRDCHFLYGRYGIITGNAGTHLSIENCEFVHFGRGRDRANVWVIPHTSWVNAGQGLMISRNKFGNENLDASDYRILFANRGGSLGGPARYPGDFAHSTAVSGGWVTLGRIDGGNDFSGGPAGLKSTVVSYTPKVLGYRIEGNVVSGTAPRYMLEFAPGAVPRTPTNTRVQVGATVPGSKLAATNAPAAAVTSF